jgi:hypothetical protein
VLELSEKESIEGYYTTVSGVFEVAGRNILHPDCRAQLPQPIRPFGRDRNHVPHNQPGEIADAANDSSGSIRSLSEAFVPNLHPLF